MLAPLLLVLAWDNSGWDLPAVRWFGNAHGFALRNATWASSWLHDGGRMAAWLVLAALALAACRASPRDTPGRGPTRGERWCWLGTMLLCVLAVPALKHFSLVSCPWHLAEFGGVARHVSHWRLLADDGPGGCFPSGHAVAAFAFVGQFFMWRRHDRRRARAWLLAVLAAGVLFGVVQLVRGAHYPSHTLWSAWLCWAICHAADRWLRLAQAARAARKPTVLPGSGGHNARQARRTDDPPRTAARAAAAANASSPAAALET